MSSSLEEIQNKLKGLPLYTKLKKLFNTEVNIKKDVNGVANNNGTVNQTIIYNISNPEQSKDDASKPNPHQPTPQPVLNTNNEVSNQKAQPPNISPFITGKAVTPPYFVGRQRVLKHLQNSLLHGESVSLLGKRRIGKSSLLLTWKQHLLEQDYRVVLVNGQTEAGKNLKCFLYAITQNNYSDKDLSADDAATYLIQWAKTQRLETQKKPVILVDECEVILQQCPHRFWERVRGGLAHIVWVFSSKQPLDSLYTHHHHQGSPFENQLKTKWLGLLDPKAATEMRQKGHFSPAQQAVLQQWAGCHPFYLQSLAGYLWLQQTTAISTVLDDFQMESERHLKDLWHSLSKKEQTTLLNHGSSPSLRSMGALTPDGKPFAKILSCYLKEKQDDPTS